MSLNTQNQIHTVTRPDYAYDAAGNMTHDATTGSYYSYDAENRLTGAAGYSYTYDADGNRVQKSNGSTGTIYWYMSPGIVAESDLTGALKSEYVFFDGERVARTTEIKCRCQIGFSSMTKRNDPGQLARSLYRQGERKFLDEPTWENYQAGIGLLKQAIALGDTDAHGWLGAAYEYGLGVRRNRRRAFRHYKIAAENGNGSAEYSLAIFYYDGIGVRKSYRSAILWLQRSSRHGIPEATHLLGHCYRYGRGVRGSRVKGSCWDLTLPQKESSKRSSLREYALTEGREPRSI